MRANDRMADGGDRPHEPMHGFEALDATARSKDHQYRMTGVNEAQTRILRYWLEDCEKGEGACMAAANRAQVLGTKTLTQLHQTALFQMDMQRRSLQRQDRAYLTKVYELRRFLHDLGGIANAWAAPQTGTCEAGACLYERYADRVRAQMEALAKRHPRTGPVRYGADSSFGEGTM